MSPSARHAVFSVLCQDSGDGADDGEDPGDDLPADESGDLDDQSEWGADRDGSEEPEAEIDLLEAGMLELLNQELADGPAEGDALAAAEEVEQGSLAVAEPGGQDGEARDAAQPAGAELAALADDPAPPAAPVAPPGRARSRGRATCTVEVAGGSLNFYASNQNFTAVCSNAFHGDQCVTTRRNTARAHCKGRPLGFLAAWLALGPFAETREEHMAQVPVVARDLDSRRGCRQLLQGSPEGRALLAYERQLQPGDAEEPI